MEQHPIPQQISSYEFKLVGEMTLKQFLKAAGGIVLALLFNSTKLVFFVKYPLVFLFGAGGWRWPLCRLKTGRLKPGYCHFWDRFIAQLFLFIKKGQTGTGWILIWPRLSLLKKKKRREKRWYRLRAEVEWRNLSIHCRRRRWGTKKTRIKNQELRI